VDLRGDAEYKVDNPTGRLCLSWEPEFRKGTETVGALRTEKDRNPHRLEPLNEKCEQNFERVALMCVSYLAMTVQRPF